MPVTIDEFVVADDPAAWRAAGFAVEETTCRIGTVRVRLSGAHGAAGAEGIVGWTLRDAPMITDLDGVPTGRSSAPLEAGGTGATHPNGVTRIDHAVLMTPDLERTVTAFAGIGVAPRRERDTTLGGKAVRQVFFRLGEVVIEVIGEPGRHVAGPATFWGLTYEVADIEASAALLAGLVSPVKDAVQPGRRITTLRHRDLGISVPTALISPRPPREVELREG